MEIVKSVFETLFAPGILLLLAAIVNYVRGISREVHDWKIVTARQNEQFLWLCDTIKDHEQRLRIVEKTKHMKG